MEYIVTFIYYNVYILVGYRREFWIRSSEGSAERGGIRRRGGYDVTGEESIPGRGSMTHRGGGGYHNAVMYI